MDFKDTGLPQDPLIQKAFNRVHQIIDRDFDDPEYAMRQVVARGIALRDGFRDDQPPVDWICAEFLAFLDEKKDPEYHRIRDDYNLSIYQTVKRIDALPEWSPKLLGALLEMPETPRDIKTICLANALAEMRRLNILAEKDLPGFSEDPDVAAEYEGAMDIGNGCAGVNTVLDYLFQDEVRKYKAYMGIEADIDPGPPPQNSGLRPLLH